MTYPDTLFRSSPAIRLLPNLGLAVLGLLITHETAYAVSAWLGPVVHGDGGGLVDHAHQSLLVAATGPPAIWITVWFVLRQLRNLEIGTTWGATRLSFAIGMLYLAQESIEMATAGPAGPGLGGLIENRAVPIGLLLVPLVARLLLRALDRAEELLRSWLAVPCVAAFDRARPAIRPPSFASPSGLDIRPGDPRGPPFRGVTTIQSLIS